MIYGAFEQVILSAMHDTGVAHSFKVLMDKERAIPLLKRQAVDLNHDVTTEALDGLFLIVGEEKNKVRKEPVACVTDILKKVFEYGKNDRKVSTRA